MAQITRIITANPVGHTVHEFDHVASDQEIIDWAAPLGGVDRGYIEHDPRLNPPHRYFTNLGTGYLAVEREGKA